MIPLAGGVASRRTLGKPKPKEPEPAAAAAKPRFDYLNFGAESDSDVGEKPLDGG